MNHAAVMQGKPAKEAGTGREEKAMESKEGANSRNKQVTGFDFGPKRRGPVQPNSQLHSVKCRDSEYGRGFHMNVCEAYLEVISIKLSKAGMGITQPINE